MCRAVPCTTLRLVRAGEDRICFPAHGNVWHPRCDRRPALLEIRIRAAHHCVPRPPVGCTERGTVPITVAARDTG